MMCKVLHVSRAGFYKWRLAVAKREAKDEERLEAIRAVHEKSRGTYGARRIVEQLRDDGLEYNRKAVVRLMKKDGLQSKHRRKFKATTNSKHNLPVAKNKLARKFKRSHPNQAWVSDITYVWTGEGWLYLVVFIDLWSRKVVGWSMSERMQSEFVMDAFEMARRRRGVLPCKILIHSDRGSQYASTAFRKLLTQNSCKQSMSRKGNCWDNAVSESFFGTIKKEMIYHSNFSTREEAKSAIFDYIEVFYNKIRKHSSISYLAPDTFEQSMKKAA